MYDYFSYTTADIVFIDDEFNDTDGQNAAKQKSDGQADDKEMATDEKTTERSDDQVITGNKTDSKENATDNETEDDDAGEHDAGEQGNITESPGNMMNISTQAMKVTKSMCNGLE